MASYAPFLHLAQRTPLLRIVVNHIGMLPVTGGAVAPDNVALIEALASHPNVFMKLSGTMEGAAHTDRKGRRDNLTHQSREAPPDLEFYRPVLELLWRCFGEDRLIYGSNWPCTKKSGNYESFVKLVNAYFSEKGEEACEKYFWKNASKAYGLGLK